MQMVHDFGEFTGGTPKEVLSQLEAVFVEPVEDFERVAGDVRAGDGVLRPGNDDGRRRADMVRI